MSIYLKNDVVFEKARISYVKTKHYLHAKITKDAKVFVFQFKSLFGTYILTRRSQAPRILLLKQRLHKHLLETL